MIAEIFSIDIALKLSENFGGMRLYIPKHETLLRSIRNQQINEFNGRNQRPLRESIISQKHRSEASTKKACFRDRLRSCKISFKDAF